MDPDPVSPSPSPLGSGINQVQRLPLGSASTNTLNTPPQRLIVEFIYKPDPRSKTKTKTYLKDTAVPVTASFSDSIPLPTDFKMDTDQGIADFGSVPAGKCKITPDYSKLDECKFDYEAKAQDIDLLPGETKTVVFEVEPLYQKIQLVAHALLTIPDKTYEPAPGETLEANPLHDPAELEQPPKKIAGGDEPQGKWKGMYHGLKEDKDDISARVSLLKATLDFAYTKAKDDPTILKVFMIPECFFQGRYGAYGIDDGSLLFGKLLEMASDVKWKDWMFVFGTVNLTFGDNVQEMMNYSPVIRGGLEIPEEAVEGGTQKKVTGGGGQDDKYFRLIQKLVNSEELLDDGDLIHHKEETRIPAVNSTVQFQATENEEKLGALLQEICEKQPDFGEKHGLPKERWEQLKTALWNRVGELGSTRVVRYIRKCKIDGKPDDLSGWGDFSGYQDKTKAHLEPEISLNVTWQGLVIKFINAGWDNYYKAHPPVSAKPGGQPPPPPGLTALRWKAAADPGPERRNFVITDIKARIDELCKQFDITLPYQKAILSGKIDELLNDDSVAIDFGSAALSPGTKPAAVPDNFGAAIYPMWKKIVELYLAETKPDDKELLTQKPESMDYHDYCFVAARKAGPWLSFEEAKDIKPCKKIIFGLEICADHRVGRLKKIIQENLPPLSEMIADDDARYSAKEIETRNRAAKVRNEQIAKELPRIEERNRNKAKVTIDIQLVPSAGMIPTYNSIVARTGGFCFNCDGWNGAVPKENIVPIWLDAPETAGANPLRPHSAIAKGGGEELGMDEFKPEKFELDNEIDSTLGDGIVSKTGLGELHVYDELELPKS